MKQLQRQPAFMRRRLLEGKTIPQRIDTMMAIDIRVDLYKCLIEQFRLARIFSITWNLEQMLIKHSQIDDEQTSNIQQLLMNSISQMI